jgi:hypothetical protein
LETGGESVASGGVSGVPAASSGMMRSQWLELQLPFLLLERS